MHLLEALGVRLQVHVEELAHAAVDEHDDGLRDGRPTPRRARRPHPLVQQQRECGRSPRLRAQARDERQELIDERRVRGDALRHGRVEARPLAHV